jgi:hypothetical protein
MYFFDLPKSTTFNKVVPKNAFDPFTNTKEKKLFTDYISRISWTNKFSTSTINLSSKDVVEIQLFKIELKVNAEVKKILEIINRAIPYPIIFWVEFANYAFVSAAVKHLHPGKLNTSVIDWTFESDWFQKEQNPYKINLKISLDHVFKNFCVQLCSFDKTKADYLSLSELIAKEVEVKRLKDEIKRLKSEISKCKQFNKKVELNLKLTKVEAGLKTQLKI